METNRRYYFLQMPEDFFQSKRIKKLRQLAGGDTFTIIYLKMQLKAMNNSGCLVYDGIDESIADEIAIDIDEDAENVKVTIAYLQKCGLLEIRENGDYYLPYSEINVGSKTASTIRSQKSRAKKKEEITKIEPKTNAERQNNYRAKKSCEERNDIPLIQDSTNKKRYNGNYYLCIRRDDYKCAICGSNESLRMHHIDGYDENKPENNNANKLITVCKECYRRIHEHTLEIPHNILESIGYYDFRNESNDNCNTNATKCNGDIYIDIEKDIYKDIYLEQKVAQKETEDDFFDSIWQLYPRKKGKSSVKKAKRKELQKVGYERIAKAIESFNSDMQGRDEQYIPYGSTFFNTLYKDYLDMPEKKKEPPKAAEYDDDGYPIGLVDIIKEHGAYDDGILWGDVSLDWFDAKMQRWIKENYNI